MLLVLILLVHSELSLQPDGKLHVYFLDVGQGDSILLVSPSGKQILIDGGSNMSALEHLGKYMPFFDRTIELLVLSHPDSDHITALPEILQRYHVEQILLTGIQHGAGRYQALLHHLAEQGTRVIFSDPSQDIDIGDGLVLDVIWPPASVFGTHPKKANDTSIVIRALFGKESILLTGDIEEKAEKAILASGVDVHSTILKSPHHGSKSSSSTGFLLAVRPQLAIISVGKDNSFGHPHQEVLDRYAQMGITVRNTIEEGTISLALNAAKENQPSHQDVIN